MSAGGIAVFKKISQATDFIKEKIDEKPLVGIITGTGLSGITEPMKCRTSISYEDIPYFPRSTVMGHKGNFLYGTIQDKPVVVMEGRFHLYEGYTVYEITLPVRVMALLGVKFLFIASAAGGLNPEFSPGELMLVEDHINLTGNNPLIGKNMEEFGPGFPDMTSAYDQGLISMAKEKAQTEGIVLNRGVYVGITGPSLETPAETRFLRAIGSDAVGMSTVNEVIAAVHSGLKVLTIVALTNINIPDSMKPISMNEVISNAGKASSHLSRLFANIIKDLER
jgi:purine-nucleoside phosphorylase